jgi:hypothetical protein
MTQDDYKQLMKQGEIAAHAKLSPQKPSDPPLAYTFEDFLPLLFVLLSPKRPLAAAPTFTPRNLLESFQLYDTGGVRRLYFYVTDTWRYTTLT